MKHGVDIGDVPSSAASLKAAEAVERFIFDEFYGGDAFIFAMAMHAKNHLTLMAEKPVTQQRPKGTSKCTTPFQYLLRA